MKYANLELGTVEAVFNKLGGTDGAKRFLAEEFTLVPKDPKKLLEFVTTTSIAAIESFKANDHFKVDTKKVVMRIAWIGDNFKVNFLHKEERASEAVELKISKLLERSLDMPMITELGDKCEITLGQFFSLLQKQGKGEAGALLVNGYANIAYIRDVNGILWAVSAGWYSAYGGWLVEANSVEGPDGWIDGFQVVSR